MTPTVAFVPETGARPNGAAASITSPQVAPGPTRAVRRSGSTSTERMREVSISSVSGDGSARCPVASRAYGDAQATRAGCENGAANVGGRGGFDAQRAKRSHSFAALNRCHAG